MLLALHVLARVQIILRDVPHEHHVVSGAWGGQELRRIQRALLGVPFGTLGLTGGGLWVERTGVRSCHACVVRAMVAVIWRFCIHLC